MSNQEQRFCKENLPVSGWRTYVKKSHYLAKRIEGPFTVVSRDGIIHCNDGYLFLNSDGWPTAIDKDWFETIFDIIPREE